MSPHTFTPHGVEPAGHPAAVAWRTVSGVSTTRLDVLAGRPKAYKSALYRLFDDSGAAPVIAKRCPAEAAERELAVYRDILPTVSMEAVTLRGVFVEEDGAHWLFLEEAPGVDLDELDPSHVAAVTAWMALLHRRTSALARPAPLPLRDAPHYRRRILSWTMRQVDGALEATAGASDVLALLEPAGVALRTFDEWWRDAEAMFATAPSCLVHGDLIAKNVRVDAECGTTVVLDWGEAGWGCPFEDLAILDLDVYAPIVEGWWPTTAIDLSHAQSLGRALQATAFIGALLWRFDARWPHAAAWSVHHYTRTLTTALMALGWVPRPGPCVP